MEAFRSIKPSLLEKLEERKTLGEVEDDGVICSSCEKFFSLSDFIVHESKCLKQPSKSIIRQSRQYITKPVFSLMKDAQLKKFLSDYDIISTGDRQVCYIPFII